MARLRATALAARSVLDGREHDGMLGRVRGPSAAHNQTSKSGNAGPSKNEIMLKIAARGSLQREGIGVDECRPSPTLSTKPSRHPAQESGRDRHQGGAPSLLRRLHKDRERIAPHFSCKQPSRFVSEVERRLAE